MKVLKPNFEKRGGYIPVVVQDVETKKVLMLAYANEEAYLKTLRSGCATFYSTSRKEIWVKGLTSGNGMHVFDVYTDCDGDALLYLVRLREGGVACHTGARSCFYRSITGRYLEEQSLQEGSGEKLDTVESPLRLEYVFSAGRGDPT